MIIGTRGSDLALWQSRHVGKLTGVAHELRIITTRGDVDMTERLAGSKLEKGFFTLELEEALRKGEIDIAVHSLKDLPTQNPAGLTVGAVLERAEAHDILLALPEVVEESSGLPLKAGIEVGASSLRREALIKRFSSARSIPLRGNVPTRLGKLRKGEPRAIILAAAGVARLQLDLSGVHCYKLNPARWVPAPGQGAIAVQCRANDTQTLAVLAKIHHAPTARAVNWERAFLRAVEGGCTTPLGAYVRNEACDLGLADSNGVWHATHVQIPAGEPADSFLKTTVSSVTGEPPDGWLYEQIN